MTTHTTRETWLQAAVEQMRPWFTQVGANTLPKVRVSCAWAKRAGRASIGWCWHHSVSADGVNEIQVSPEIDDPVKVLATLLHEMVHASDDGESGHKGYFRTVALALGLDGPMTATYAGEDLARRLQVMTAELGPYPHAALNPTGTRPGKPTPGPGGGGGYIGKQTTRMLKLVCPDDGYTVRTTRKWIDVGLPTCPCGTEMELAL